MKQDLETYKLKFVEEVRNFRRSKRMTIKDLSAFMADRIPNLSTVQARHYLEGRFPRDARMRDAIIRLFQINESYLEGWVSVRTGDAISSAQEAYHTMVSLKNLQCAQEMLSRVIHHSLDFVQKQDVSVNVYRVNGRWYIFPSDNTVTGCLYVMILNPRDYVMAEVRKVDTFNPEVFLKGPDSVGKLICTLSVTSDTLEFLTDKFKKG